MKNFVTRNVKHILGLVLFRTGLYRLLMPSSAVISLFHRVDDRLADDEISCSVERFNDFCDFFKRYYTVISYADLLERLRNNQSLRGYMVITFDDGYLDNRVVAAKELIKRQLPACFFVITGYIGTNRIPWWDKEKGIQSEWMSWDDVRDLDQEGYELGCHTVNHLDLGEIYGPEAKWEIEESRRVLEREVGRKIDLFSYPFGRVDQCSEENREIVRQLGLVTCPSAYGGVVPPGSDPFYLKRTSISHWFISPYHFGIDMIQLGWRSKPNSRAENTG